MERCSEVDFEEDTLIDNLREVNLQQRRPHKGGKNYQEEPISMSELLACPLAITCFRHQSCFDFCEMVEKHLVPLTPVEQEVVNEREI